MVSGGRDPGNEAQASRYFFQDRCAGNKSRRSLLGLIIKTACEIPRSRSRK